MKVRTEQYDIERRYSLYILIIGLGLVAFSFISAFLRGFILTGEYTPPVSATVAICSIGGTLFIVSYSYLTVYDRFIGTRGEFGMGMIITFIMPFVVEYTELIPALIIVTVYFFLRFVAISVRYLYTQIRGKYINKESN